jgi:hypothetical protein
MKKEKVGLITFEESEVDQIEGIGEGDAEKVFPRLLKIDDSSSRTNDGATGSCMLCYAIGSV